MTIANVTAEHLESVEAFVTRYVSMPSEEATTALAEWVLHTWAGEASTATPYLIVLSPERRSGKTLLLEVIELLVRRPWRIASTSEAAMFRKIQQETPTLLLDEIDAIFGATSSDRTEALRALLNAGNRRGSCVARCVGQGTAMTVVDFPVYCPKVLAGIDTGKLPDTIRDRGVEIRMQRKAPGEEIRRFRLRDVEPAAAELRGALAEWAGDAIPILADAVPDLPNELNDRAADAWEPLFAIADLAGRGEQARAAAVILSADSGVDELSYGTRLLAKLRDLLGERTAIATSEIIEAVNGDEELPFGGWRAGHGLDARGLARLVKPYGLKPRTVRDGDGTSRGYHRDAALESAFARYLTETTQATQATHVLDVSDVLDPDGSKAGDQETAHEWWDAADQQEVAS